MCLLVVKWLLKSGLAQTLNTGICANRPCLIPQNLGDSFARGATRCKELTGL